MAAILTKILNYSFLGNTLKEYLVALGVFLLTIIVLKIFKKVIIGKIKKIADHTKTDFDDLLIKILNSIGWPFYIFLALYLAFQFVKLPPIIEKGVYWLSLILVIYYIGRGGGELIDYGFGKIAQKRKKVDEKFDSSVLELLAKISKGILWAIAIIVVLQNLGYNISALVAGLGIGGLAVAFAIQNILSDIFASFSIYFDKPFQPGDFIVIGDDKGTVKKIGIKSTRIQTLQGEELVISNKELTESRVHNYKKMEKRRITFAFGVVYETPTEKLKKIPIIVKN
ncbi:mechanosensitive ion channel family protein, partial [bacterium]|nr:mechanosensitive ion channel family protein [bacterium]